jgi:hypothetical protein
MCSLDMLCENLVVVIIKPIAMTDDAPVRMQDGQSAIRQ